MKKPYKTRFKKGAASFYIVAFSTLILLIIATSFAAIIISSVTRTTNDDLSQSAYDSALAGIEDAKLAFYNYQNCLKQGDASAAMPRPGDPLTCSAIMWYVEQGGRNEAETEASDINYSTCDMVSRILGRVGTDEASEVVIQETDIASNNMQQAYTCTKINTSLKDYRSTLSSTNQIRVVRVKLDNGVQAKDIKKVKISWGSNISENDFSYSNFSSGKVIFPQTGIVGFGKVATPPTISLALIQTANEFSLSDFDTTRGSTTNRGMVYMVPTGGDNGTAASKNVAGNYKAGYNAAEGINHIGAAGFLESNNKLGDTNKNLPYAVYCPRQSESSATEFACSTVLDLPDPVPNPVNGERERSNDTFTFVVGLPYGKPATDFSLEFYCSEGTTCYTDTFSYEDGEGNTVTTTEDTNRANLKGVQIEIDSTGRANDLFRRVTARLEAADDVSLSIMGPLELLGDTGSEVLKKDYRVTKEWNF